MKEFQLPVRLLKEIEPLISEMPFKTLQTIATQLSFQYREKAAPFHFTPESRLAYLAARLPATYAVVSNLLNKIPMPNKIESILDLGSGPGTVLWAAMQWFPFLKKATLLEKDRDWIDLAALLKNQISYPSLQTLEWDHADLNIKRKFPEHDLVVCSYALGELNFSREFVESIWKASKNYLLVIEPGTTKGFDRLRQVRSILLDTGAHLLAPCTHDWKCPLALTDWCHFSLRLERPFLQRLSKAAELPFEDEKFSYLIFSRQLVHSTGARVIRRPIKKSGHVTIDLCEKEGIQRKTISKKQKEVYRQVRKLSWGDMWISNEFHES